MKKQLLLLLFATFSLLPDFPYAFEVDGIYYKLTGNGEYSVKQGPKSYFGEVVIPATVIYKDQKYSVTSIGDDAFFKCYRVTSVTIPNFVKNRRGGVL